MPLEGQKVRYHLLLGRKAYYKLVIWLFPIQNRQKWVVLKLGGGCSWTKIGPLDSGDISPSPVEPIELGETCPDSNGPPEGCKQLQKLSQKGSIFEKLALNTSIFLSFWSVKSWISFRCHMAVDLSYYGVSREAF